MKLYTMNQHLMTLVYVIVGFVFGFGSYIVLDNSSVKCPGEQALDTFTSKALLRYVDDHTTVPTMNPTHAATQITMQPTLAPTTTTPTIPVTMKPTLSPSKHPTKHPTNVTLPTNHFIAYANAIYMEEGLRIVKDAQEIPLFDTVTLYTESVNKELPVDVQEFIRTHRRGAGYWIWKPYIIKKKLQELNDNDILIYADSGCTFDLRCGFDTRLEQLKTNEIIVLWSGELEYWRTKEDLFSYMNVTRSDIRTSRQIAATFIYMRKTPKLVKLVDEWSEIALHPHLIDDSPSILPNHKDFREHRYDQSILSLLVKLKNIQIYDTLPCEVLRGTRRGPRITTN